MKNIILCTHCGKPTSFERMKEEEPHEGEVCDICDDWICWDCMDWGKSCMNGHDVVCKECAKMEYVKEGVAQLVKSIFNGEYDDFLRHPTDFGEE